MRREQWWVGCLLLTTVLGACGGGGSSLPPASTTYDGPLRLAAGEGRHPVAGAAGEVVDCETFGTGSAFHGEVYDQGATADSPDQALDHAFSEGLFLSLPLPRNLEVAATEDDRVLYVAEVDGVPKAAVVVRDGPGSEGAGGDGWHLESWAACDIVELPADFVGQQGYQVWTDEDGAVAPTDRLEVFAGPEHCDWDDMTFLSLGRWDDDVPTYVRLPVPELEDYVDEPFLAHTRLPRGAEDTGFRRGDVRLWLAPDRSRAYVGETPTDVELWPRTTERLGCA